MTKNYHPLAEGSFTEAMAAAGTTEQKVSGSNVKPVEQRREAMASEFGGCLSPAENLQTNR